MNMNLAYEIAQLALSLVQRQAGGTVPHDAAVTAMLLEIVQKAAQAYRDHAGEELDPSLIRVELPV